MYSPEELGELADVVIEKDLTVIADEIYERLVYGENRFASFATVRPGLAERTVIVNGVSKAYAMTGWRIGWTLSPPAIAKAMADLQSQETSNPSSISQYAALAALEGPQECVDTMLAEFAKRREFVRRRIGRAAQAVLPAKWPGRSTPSSTSRRTWAARTTACGSTTRPQWCLALLGAAERGHGDGLGLRRRGLRADVLRHQHGKPGSGLRPDRGVSAQRRVMRPGAQAEGVGSLFRGWPSICW